LEGNSKKDTLDIVVKSIRLDKWLWAARFYKTRSLSSKAVSTGKVLLNGLKTKPSRIVHLQDQLKIKKGKLSWLIIIVSLSDRRGSANIAATLYKESQSSIENRQQMSLQMKQRTSQHHITKGRPTKRNRRLIDSINNR
tara:strand:+ start:189 stop:605 length:417 start_codon:yes stop_codon:yes gene_type:complete